jgi:hypothetical protein
MDEQAPILIGLQNPKAANLWRKIIAQSGRSCGSNCAFGRLTPLSAPDAMPTAQAAAVTPPEAGLCATALEGAPRTRGGGTFFELTLRVLRLHPSPTAEA